MVGSNVDMREALRLTRQGRLVEAMAVLRGELTGESATGQAAESSRAFIDMVPPSNEDGAWTAPATGMEIPVSSASRAMTSGTLLDRLLDGVVNRPTKSAVLPPGATFGSFSFANDAGNRRYKLYVPSGYDGQPLPLLVMLHGCAQSPDDFAAGTRMNEVAEEHLFLVAYPIQAKSANASKCWNWFNESDQQRDQGEPSLIAGITRQIMRDFSVDSRRVYVAGLSAGGAAAAVMGATYPDVYAAIGVHSGLACGAARDLPSAFVAMRRGGVAGALAEVFVPTIVFHGGEDTVVNPVNGDQIFAKAHVATTFETTIVCGRTPGGLRFVQTKKTDGTGRSMIEKWVIHGAAHAWSGGSSAGSFTDPRGPDASREIVRFFLQHSTRV